MRWQAFLAMILLLVAGCVSQPARAADPSGGIRYDSRSRTWTNTPRVQTLPAVVSPVTTSAPASSQAREEFVEYTLSPPPTTRPAPSPSRATPSQPSSPVTPVSDRVATPAVAETWGWNGAPVVVTSGGYGYGYSSGYGGLRSYAYPTYTPLVPYYGTGGAYTGNYNGTYNSNYGSGIYVQGTWNQGQSGWYGGNPNSCATGGSGTHSHQHGGSPARPHPVPHRR